MTRDEAVELLKSGPKGVQTWNEWKKKHYMPTDLERIGLRGSCMTGAKPICANLIGLNLQDANLQDANLIGLDLRLANLSSANLRDAQLGESNLIGAKLVGACLVDADATGVHLSGANLSGANLTGAHLAGGRFCAANLTGANLNRADLSSADFTEADLTDSILSGALLRSTMMSNALVANARIDGAEFSRTWLDRANFTQTKCGYADFSDVDLSATEGLELIVHDGPSTVGIDTIVKSRGKIPEIFLRGCGVPDEFIRYIPSLIGSMSPLEFYSCFISYSHKDEEFCQRLHARLRDKGLRVWFAPEEMKGGKKLIDLIDAGIRRHDKLLLVLTEHSMKSDWVATEIYKARQREKKEGRQVLFPIRLCSFDAVRDWQSFDADSGKDMAREIREYFVPDFSNWKDQDGFEQGFVRLLKDLRATEATTPAERES